MAKQTIRSFHCLSCPDRHTYLEHASMRGHGVTLHFGDEYCAGGKKYRVFKKKDPKTYPPSWCPKLKWPCDFRVYTFKDSTSWYTHQLFHRDDAPSGYACAVRVDGTVELRPTDFLSELEEKTASELLGIEVKTGEVVEIDDGLKACCFYIGMDGVQYLPYWDAARARQNQYLKETRGGPDDADELEDAETPGDADASEDVESPKAQNNGTRRL